MPPKKPQPKTTTKVVLQGAHAKLHEQARLRLVLVAAFILIGYSVVCFRLVDLTLFREVRSVRVASVNVEDIDIALTLPRADIVDRFGTIIASSLKTPSVYVDPRIVNDPEDLAVKISSILPEQDYLSLLKKLNKDKSFVWVQRNITPKQKQALNSLGNPAIGFQDENQRVYPHSNLTAHITGYTDIDGNGIAGIEKFFDKALKETDKALALSIDLRVQYIMHNELSRALKKFKAKSGIGMVMDVNSGEVISMVSLPDFNPNNFRKAVSAQMFNRATLGVFEMGSTFKLFSTAAALESGLVNFSTKFDVRKPIQVSGFTISDFHSKKRPLTVPEVFIYSSNVGTAKMAELLGNEKMQSFFRTLGFFDQLDIELPERGHPIYPSPWRDINTLTTSFGHGIAVSPLHLVRASSALVNGGVIPKATLIKVEDDLNESGVEEVKVVSEKVSKKLRQLLELVVVGGTGNNAYVHGYNVGGKTGTANKNINGVYHDDAIFSSFIGVFPIDKPRYAVLAILDEPQPTKETKNSATGGWTAAPVVAKVIENMGVIYQMPSDKNRTPKDIEKEMGAYLKGFKEGRRLASAGIDR